MAKKTTSDLNLEKFGSIGGDYFEALVAVALDELGYVHGETYLASWDKVCVPGTWIEADFIVSPKNDKSKDPLKNCKFVFAIGHATSANSAQMKFHRDFEQLLEVKALPNGDDIMVFDILFCCPRETMGGWSKELVAINEAIFDNSIIVWKEEWGVMLLYHMQRLAEQFSKQGELPVKVERVKGILANDKEFRTYFDHLRLRIDAMLSLKASHSKIGEMFKAERKCLSQRMQIPLLITSQEKTEFKRGLLQVLALNDWELELLYENHKQKVHPEKYPLEQLAYDRGMSPEKFTDWWTRLNLLSIKIGKCWRACPATDDILSSDEMCCFKASDELSYVFRKFNLNELKSFIKNVPDIAHHLMPYTIDLTDLTRVKKIFQLIINKKASDIYDLCVQCFNNASWQGMDMPRLLVFELIKSIISYYDNDFSYRTIASEFTSLDGMKNSHYLHLFAGKLGTVKSPVFAEMCTVLSNRLSKLNYKDITIDENEILKKFIYDRFDGMVKQRQKSVIDVLIYSEINELANELNADLIITKMKQGIPCPFNIYAGTEKTDLNIEVPYIIKLKRGDRIFIHRVNANDGHAADKRKEFSSKIRMIRYQSKSGKIVPAENYYTSILVLDGNWIKPGKDDPYSHIRMLTVAGWDYVVYPDGLSEAFSLLKERLKKDGLLK